MDERTRVGICYGVLITIRIRAKVALLGPDGVFDMHKWFHVAWRPNGLCICA